MEDLFEQGGLFRPAARLHLHQHLCIELDRIPSIASIRSPAVLRDLRVLVEEAPRRSGRQTRKSSLGADGDAPQWRCLTESQASFQRGSKPMTGGEGPKGASGMIAAGSLRLLRKVTGATVWAATWLHAAAP